MVDGTFLVTDQLVLNGAGPIADVHTMMGFMRYDGSAFIGLPVGLHNDPVLPLPLTRFL